MAHVFYWRRQHLKRRNERYKEKTPLHIPAAPSPFSWTEPPGFGAKIWRQRACSPALKTMKRPMSKKPFLWGLMLLTLSAGPVGCFIVYGGSRARSSAHSPAGRRCVNRPLLQRRPHHRSRGALEAHLLSRTAGSSAGGFDGQRRLPDRRRSAGITRLRQVSFRRFRCLMCRRPRCL